MTRKLISFDWAMKRLLRSKANYEVLEGFLSELLKDDLTIVEILESESNQETHWVKSILADQQAREALTQRLTRWAETSEQPIILLLDEVNALVGDTLISLLRQIRATGGQLSRLRVTRNK